jgi:hypothetical protein
MFLALLLEREKDSVEGKVKSGSEKNKSKNTKNCRQVNRLKGWMG